MENNNYQPNISFDECLETLKLFKYKDAIEHALIRAMNDNLPPREAVHLVLEEVASIVKNKRTELLMQIAHFPKHTLSETYNLDSSLADKSKVEEFLELSWINNGLNIFMYGPSGLGKTLLSVELGKRAVLQGYTTFFCLARDLPSIFQEKSHTLRFSNHPLFTSKLLIIDDIGHISSKDDSDLSSFFYQVMDKRYHNKSSTIITSNIQMSEWGELLGNKQTAAAALDRFVENAFILIFEGESYRNQKFKQRNKEAIEQIAKKHKVATVSK